MILYQDFDSTRIQSDGKISPEDYLTITQRRNIHQSFPSSTEFTDNGLDGIVDDSFGIFSKEEIAPTGTGFFRVYPMSGDTILGFRMHFFGANLYFENATVGTEDGGVQ